MKDNILFRKKSTGEYFTFSDDTGRWELTKEADLEQAKDNYYVYVNEIMSDHNLEFEDIEMIYIDKYKREQ